MTYIDAILQVCDDNKIEPEDVRKFVSKVVKEKLEAEASALNYLPRTNSLPLE
jgi:cell division ATPase FtsA